MLCSVLPEVPNQQCNGYGNCRYPCYSSHYRYYARNRSCNHVVSTSLLEQSAIMSRRGIIAIDVYLHPSRSFFVIKFYSDVDIKKYG